MKQIGNTYKKDNGVAMIWALIILFVITLLGTTLFFFANQSLSTASYSKEKMEAYFLSRSATKAISDYIRYEESIEGEYTITDLDEDYIDRYKVFLKIERKDTGHYTIRANSEHKYSNAAYTTICELLPEGGIAWKKGGEQYE